MPDILKAVLLSCLLLGMANAQAELPPDYRMTLLTANFPPFNMAKGAKDFARGDEVQGIATDAVREVFKRAGIAYSLTLRSPWNRVYEQTLALPDHGLLSVARSEKNKAQFKWVGPLAQYESVLLAAPGSALAFENLAQAKGYKIGAYKNGGVSHYLESQQLAVVETLQDEENLRKLLSGRIDLWATAEPVWRTYAKQENVTGLRTVLSFRSEKLYLALNRNTPDEVVQRLQKAMDEVIAEGYGGCSKTPDLCYLIRDRGTP
ncbi:MAG: ABC transporter substrate-binding protein [Pseudomonadota bacterium]